jgi:small-conductance mechanosensitive channel
MTIPGGTMTDQPTTEGKGAHPPFARISLFLSSLLALTACLLSGPALAAETATQMAGERHLVRLGLQVREALGKTLASLPEFDARTMEILTSHSATGSLDWIWSSVFVLAGALATGAMALVLCERWLFARFLNDRRPDGAGARSERIIFLIARGAIMLLAVAPFMAAAVAVAFVFVSGHPASRVTVLIGLEGALTFLVLRIVLRAILAPGLPGGRMLPLATEQSNALYRGLMTAGGISISLMAVCGWMDALGLEPAGHRLGLILSVGMTCLMLSTVAIVNRKALTGLIANAGLDTVDTPSPLRRIAARLWLPVLIAYFAAAFVVSAVRVLLQEDAAIGLVAAPVYAIIIWAVVLGVLTLVIDRVLLPRLDSETQLERRARDLARAETSAGEVHDEDETRAQAAAEALEAERQRLPYRDLLDHGAGILAVVVAAGSILVKWGVDITGDGSVVGNAFEICVIVFLAYMAYRAVELAIDRQIHRENGNRSEAGHDMEIGGVGESRLATLLPIFRNFLLISIVSIGTMIVLSEMGVNIGPLFAGAGVVGLAVGFGAQTLIRDIFSGAFFLFDDAFRKGEYIDIGSVKGTVEKISIRSMQLRHHNGPLNTVPFGEIKYVKNFSRDWAVMKLAFRVTYDTDVEKMRKLIKKFGQSLLEHEEYGPKFLQPVKSQGVTALEDSAMIVRVKFMTRPGDQFELRKVVYSGIRDLCEANGIHFAHRQVTVRVAQEGEDQRELSEAEKTAAAGAARALLDQEAAAKSSGSSSDDR